MPSDAADAIARVGRTDSAQFIAGGTSQVDLLKEGVQRPAALVDIFRIGLDGIGETEGGGLSIGANVRNSVASDHPVIRERYTAIAEALHAGASQQIRNMASMAGNLLQRTRCPYLRDPAQPCNKRDPGSGLRGGARVQPHARDLRPDRRGAAVAAHLHRRSPLRHGGGDGGAGSGDRDRERGGERRIAFEELHRLPGDDPSRDTNLAPDDLIVAIELPAFHGKSHYLKVRDRASYAYALVSCADGGRDGRRPDRKGADRAGQRRAQAVAVARRRGDAGGRAAERRAVRRAAAAGLEGARAYPMNGYKPELARVLVARGLAETTGLEPLQGPAGTAFAASVGGIAGVHEAA